MTGADILERAASAVDTAWAQGNGSEHFSSLHGHCAITAIAHVGAINGYAQVVAYQALIRSLGGQGVDYSAIWKWNDTPGRTKEEVSAMLRAVAASLRAAVHDEGTPATESTDGDLSTEDAGQVEEVCI